MGQQFKWILLLSIKLNSNFILHKFPVISMSMFKCTNPWKSPIPKTTGFKAHTNKRFPHIFSSTMSLPCMKLISGSRFVLCLLTCTWYERRWFSQLPQLHQSAGRVLPVSPRGHRDGHTQRCSVPSNQSVMRQWNTHFIWQTINNPQSLLVLLKSC